MHIDLHCHLLPGIDDGPPSMADALALARAQRAVGVGTVVATPHVGPVFPHNRAASIADDVAELRAELARANVALEVLPGAEIAAAGLPDLDADELRGLSLGGAGSILLEAPLTGDFPIERAAGELFDAGLGVVLAHPERCELFLRAPARLRALVDEGALTQVTAGSLAGVFGRTARAAARQWAADGLVHNVASDAHDLRRRGPGLLLGLQEAGLQAYADAWCRQTPETVLGRSAALPAAPAAAAEAGDDPHAAAAAMAADGADAQAIEEHLARHVQRGVARRIARRLLRERGPADT